MQLGQRSGSTSQIFRIGLARLRRNSSDVVSPGDNDGPWYENDGSEGFSEHITATGLDLWGLCDVDADGDLDLADGANDTKGAPGAATIYLNKLGEANSPPTAPSNLRVSQYDRYRELAVMEWDAATDPESAPGFLTYNVRAGSTTGGCVLSASVHDAVVPVDFRRVESSRTPNTERQMNMREQKPDKISEPETQFLPSLSRFGRSTD